MLLNCAVGEGSWEPLEQHRDPTWNQSWIFIGRTDVEAKTPILWPPYVKNCLMERPWCWDRLKAGERDDRGWDGRMVSLTQWTWVWVNSGSWWWTGRPGMLQSMGSQRVGHDWATELNWWLSIVTHPAYLTSMQSRSCNILGWMKHKLESRLQWKITSDIQMIPF